ncbi:hypothetical protein HARCEL1_09315 [Halococcoides cellulosivorans]|uniref:Uncharacterized protein n=1 Tax=Halococcoides cellulosivorans TaxID=1679096 RepID=A0A2R4X4H0_9EURY|nr:hypothetical protein HARCEL1_09315 [Halococcoides cellulosivorans]
MYDRTYGTDWDDLDRESVIARAFALGVDEALGNPNPEERERLVETMGSAYDRSVVDLAYQEGLKKASNRTPTGETDERSVWRDLVDGDSDDPVDVPPDPTEGGRTSLPSALSSIEALERKAEDSRDSLQRPEFLDG